MGPYADALLPLRSVEYINASPIDNLGEGAMPFIATMCPKRETFAHFWSMVWELGSRVIINLTHERDRVGSGPSDKRERYWPPLEDVSERQMSRWPVRPYTIGTEACEQVPALLRYTIELRGPLKSGDKPADAAAAAAAESQRPRRIVYLYWYSRWVDFPSSSSIGSMAFYSNAWSVLHIGIHIAAEIAMLGPEHWAVCHCSAGVGRTGTFLALLHLLTQLPSIRDENELDAAVTLTIENMREKRLWMVKTDIEFATLYAALLLRLRNPEDKEFALTWPLKEGQRAPLIDKQQMPPTHPNDYTAAAVVSTGDAAADDSETHQPAGSVATGSSNLGERESGGGMSVSPGIRHRATALGEEDEEAAMGADADDNADGAGGGGGGGLHRPAKRAAGPAAAGLPPASPAPGTRPAGGGFGFGAAAAGAAAVGQQQPARSMSIDADDGVSGGGGGDNTVVQQQAPVGRSMPPPPVIPPGGGAGTAPQGFVISPGSGLRVRTPEDDEEMEDTSTTTAMDADNSIDNTADVSHYAGVGGGAANLSSAAPNGDGKGDGEAA